MSEHPLVVLWRRKWVAIATILIFVTVTAVVSKTVLPKVYSATATLWINQKDVNALDAVQTGQVLARTYDNIIDSNQVASRVASILPSQATGRDVLDHMSFAPVTETQLLRVTAEDQDPRKAQLYANTYAAVFVAYARNNLREANRSTVTLADRASLPSAPARPKPTLYVTLAAFLGLIFGVALAFLVDFLDRRVRSPEALAELLGAPILAPIPRRSRNPQSQALFEESFRLLRANLQFARTDRPIHCLTVTSPSDGEGKTTTSVGIAKAFAETGQHVVLVEGDLRRPSLRAHLYEDNVPPFPVGLSNYLVHAVGLHEIIHHTGEPNISLIPAGPIPPNPSTLLEASRRLLQEEALRAVDMVIIDTPPLSVGADASLLAASSDGVLMVVDLDRSRKPAIKRARDQLERTKAEVIGAVVNRVRGTGASYYQYQPQATNGRTRMRGWFGDRVGGRS